MPTEILVIPRNHFDPTWRRAFARPITFNAVTVQPYARIEEEVFERWLALAPRGYSFSESQAAVWREYLRRNPARLERLQAELAAGRLCVQLAGETVQDTSLPASEGLIRNFLVAQPLYRELGVLGSPAQEVAWVEDAFGNSPNYPQILAGVGAKAVAKLTYRTIPSAVWTGIDGTSLACMDQLKHEWVSPFIKHPPCPACRGAGCAVCAGSGVAWMPLLQRAEIEAALERAITVHATDAKSTGPQVHVTIGGEEVLPDACVLDAIAAVEARHPGVRFRFATWGDLWLAAQTELLAAVAAHDGAPSPDLNPGMPGCQVTRIALKQRTRDLAHRLGEAESALATRSWEAGAPVRQPVELGEAWRLVAFNQFHDAITGTLVDGGADELHGMLDRAAALTAPQAPPRPLPAAPALFAAPTRTAGRIQLGQLAVAYDHRGITAVAHAGRTLCTVRPLACTREALRIGELGLENDFGDAWAKRIPPLDQYGCVPLSDFHTGVEVADGALRWQGTYAGGDRKVKRLTWTMTVRASADGRALDFAVEVDWHAESKRLRAWFPVVGTEGHATYEVPFGHVDRACDDRAWDYGLVTAHQNEFPMQNWIRAACTGGGHAAVLTRGLPGVRWMPGTATSPGTIDLSLLRAPEAEFCQVEAHLYEFWDNAGMLDTGRHVFAYQLRVDAGGLSTSDLTAAGLALNRPGFIAPPFAVEGAQVSAWKPAEDGHGWILRVHDASGEGGMVSLRFAEERSVTTTDLLERPTGTAQRGRSWSGPLRRHGIQTVRIA